MNGGIASSSSCLPYNTPIPIGPMSLWPENAKKSAPSSCTSIAICGVLCAPSTTTTAPKLCALSAIFLTGFTHPRTFDTCPTASSFVCSLIPALMVSSVSVPSFSQSRYLRVAPVALAAICHGSILLWCSMMVTAISSPAFRLLSA